jgi:hypothetical protein
VGEEVKSSGEQRASAGRSFCGTWSIVASLDENLVARQGWTGGWHLGMTETMSHTGHRRYFWPILAMSPSPPIATITADMRNRPSSLIGSRYWA